MIELATRTSEAAGESARSDAPTSINEAARVAALHDYGILDTPREPAFDDITRVATIVCRTPMSAINLVDSGRQWFKSEVGLGGMAFPIESSICAHAIVDDDLFVVQDLQEDPRFADNPLVVAEPRLRFYAGAPLRTPDGHVLGMVCVLDHVPRALTGEQEVVLRALAGQVMSQLELRRMVRSAERSLGELIRATRSVERESAALEADIAKDEILGLISHELQTPLMIIDGTARLLRREMTEADRTRAIEEIATSSQRMSRLIRNMMVLARNGDAGNLVPEPILLRLSFAAALAEHVRLHPDSPVALDADPHLPPVLGDATCVDQVLTNLLSNAAKYGDPTQSVTLTAERRGKDVLVCVANAGEPVDLESIERLFEPFYRDSAHSGKTPGIGLGLAVCRRLIEAQGGKIWAQPRAGGGLEACFTLPVAESD